MNKVLRESVGYRELVRPLVAHKARSAMATQMTADINPASNHILRALPPHERARLLANLQPASFDVGDVLYESGDRLDHMYFLTTCVVSALYTTEEGATAEMGLVGNDGVVGMPLFLGGDSSVSKAVAVVAGCALKMKVKTLRDEFAAGGPLQWLLLRYTQAFITQVSQAAVCNGLHTADQRLCRWLLMCHDRVQTNDLQMTQEFISNVLGGRRETVTVAAGRLQDAGLIRYSRGHITILNRRGLETAACECYSAVRSECDRLSVSAPA
jgi:CRP-like cAMP-binding protein